MATDMLAKIFEHNNWANQQVVDACLQLTAEQLEATLDLPSPWTMAHTLRHLVGAQQRYVLFLTESPEERASGEPALPELTALLHASGAALLELARASDTASAARSLTATDGHVVEAWVVLLQAINHATEHRKQLCGQLRALGITPPRVDGWAFGSSVGALEPRLE